ncbi:MAG: nicotinamide riboside transporter PnuC [Marinilabiliales bacterium]|nr:MAG: nicotinamide riboside transporter PnuC [Marinilabiliales bacterium]
MEIVLNWITENWFELSAAALGIVAIFLQIKQNAWYWGVSIIMVTMYIWVYIQAKLYADMSLQVYFLIVGIYGWWAWLFGKKVKESRKAITVSRITNIQWIVISLFCVGSFFLIAWILIDFTNSDVPYWDAFTTALSFAATWMLARKKIENWLIWIVVDLTSSVIYFYKGLYPTMGLFIFLTIMAVIGYLEWKKDLKSE